jgi:hypothetical protein
MDRMNRWRSDSAEIHSLTPTIEGVAPFPLTAGQLISG